MPERAGQRYHDDMLFMDATDEFIVIKPDGQLMAPKDLDYDQKDHLRLRARLELMSRPDPSTQRWLRLLLQSMR